ncbi:MAG: hypothetical protein IPI49_31830 [Myxococcales bacterium]|jgi:hypothetical protein|nr:hypothetical protein [Myxococcales bacterium]HRC55168.1 hypothetical protein [Kofleriaceae bacterium]
MKVTGTVRRSDLEGGHWVMETEKGVHYQLEGEVALLKDGQRAELTGELDKNRMGIGMMGAYFRVKKVHAL